MPTGAGGVVTGAINTEEAGLVPQLLLAVTVILPPVLPVNTFMLGVLLDPLHPVGTDQVYDVAALTGLIM